MGGYKSSGHRPERLHPGHPGLWGGRGLPRTSVHLGSSSFRPGWPSLVTPPLSAGRCWPSSPRTPEGPLPGPKLQRLWLQLLEGEMGSLQGPRPCPGFSRHTSVAFRRSLGHRRAKEQRAEKGNGERQDQGPAGKSQWWGKGAGETY